MERDGVAVGDDDDELVWKVCRAGGGTTNPSGVDGDGWRRGGFHPPQTHAAVGDVVCLQKQYDLVRIVGRYCAYADTHQPPAGAWRAAPNHQRPSAVGHSIAAQRQHQLHCRLHKSPVCVYFKSQKGSRFVHQQNPPLPHPTSLVVHGRGHLAHDGFQQPVVHQQADGMVLGLGVAHERLKEDKGRH